MDNQVNISHNKKLISYGDHKVGRPVFSKLNTLPHDVDAASATDEFVEWAFLCFKISVMVNINFLSQIWQSYSLALGLAALLDLAISS